MPLLFPASGAKVAAAFSVANSCRFNIADSPSLVQTPSAGNADRWTYSIWFKRSTLASGTYLLTCVNGSNDVSIGINSSDGLFWTEYPGSIAGKLQLNRVFRDVSAWYHIVFTWDSANATAGNRMRMYINGTEETSFSTDTNPSSGQDSVMGTAYPVAIGTYNTGSNFFGGYFAEVAYCNGQAYAASDFGEFDEDSPTIWKPKDVSTLTFGTGGFYLDFEDSSDLGKDVSGQGNDFTVSNLAAVDQCTDTPTNNFNTLNPLNISSYSTLSEGNTAGVGNNASDNGAYSSTISPAAGKWYAECKYTTIVSGYPSSGARQINNTNFNSISNGALGFCGYNNYEVGFNALGDLLVNNSVSSDWGSDVSAGDIVQFAVDCDNGAIYVGINNTWQNSGDPTSGATKTGAGTTWTPGSTFQGINFGDAGYNGSTVNWNFGNPSYANTSDAADANGYGAFEYAPPSGYLALCTKNLGSDGG